MKRTRTITTNNKSPRRRHPVAGASAKLGLVLASILLVSVCLIIGPGAPSRGATAAAIPHASGSCSQPGGDFTDGSAVVGTAVTPDDGGYWIVNNAGQISACGDAVYYGQPATLNKPVVGIAATPDGGGYYEVASDGGIFAYGDAHFQGSTGNIALNKPVVGMAVDPATGGYWLVASDGGIFRLQRSLPRVDRLNHTQQAGRRNGRRHKRHGLLVRRL